MYTFPTAFWQNRHSGGVALRLEAKRFGLTREDAGSEMAFLSPAASASVSVLLVATVAIGVLYYLSTQPSASTGSGASGSPKRKARAKQQQQQSNKGKSKTAVMKPPPAMPVRILYGTQTGASKSTWLPTSVAMRFEG
ncbi:hypothetical protein BBJ28_00020919 [Nothophytophthora sp. Chile5]|nr:hypothetical protein BBJ28_00020919 [Nothophytophthora sp. Chile5]